MSLSEVSLYLHVPFCKSRCSYCDFVSYTDFSSVDDYFKAVDKELLLWKQKYPYTKLSTVYIGGGTPSDVPDWVNKTLHYIFQIFDASQCEEVTIEVNPGCSAEVLKSFSEMGVNRLSIGLQCADDEVLNSVKRTHSVSDFLKTYSNARRYFQNVNIDFIVGLPRETEKSIEKNISILKQCDPEHVSVYMLEIHSGETREVSEKLSLAEEADEHYEMFITEVEKNWRRYEISNFSKAGFECIHNLRYWNNQQYIGVGVSAGGHIEKIRYVNCASIKDYISRINEGRFPRAFQRFNNHLEELKERLFMGLRLANGVSVEELLEHMSQDELEIMCKRFEGFVERQKERIVLTQKGFDFSKSVLLNIVDYVETFQSMGGGGNVVR